MTSKVVMVLVIAAVIDGAHAADIYADVGPGFPKLDAPVDTNMNYEAATASQRARREIRRGGQFDTTRSDRGGQIVTIGGLTVLPGAIVRAQTIVIAPGPVGQVVTVGGDWQSVPPGVGR